jgi:hypothetical protein
MKHTTLVWICSVLIGGGIATSASAQQFVYPKNNQTPEQQKQDEFDCHTWAVQQTGYDPIQASQTPPAPVPTEKATAEKGSGVRGAAKGAAVGAVVGEVADDDAGKGAAAGRMRSKREAEAKQLQQVAQANQAAANQAQLAEKYNKARGACLEGKGYTVK